MSAACKFCYDSVMHGSIDNGQMCHTKFVFMDSDECVFRAMPLRPQQLVHEASGLPTIRRSNFCNMSA
jgi:hypothetical protein